VAGPGLRKVMEALISVPILVFGIRILRDMRQAPTGENISYFVLWAVLSYGFLLWSARYGRERADIGEDVEDEV